MTNHNDATSVPPSTLDWVNRHVEVGERIVRAKMLQGGITADMRRLTIAAPGGSHRFLVLRSYVDPFYVEHAAESLKGEAAALSPLKQTEVSAPGLIAVDPTATHCEHPSLLMTHLDGRTILHDDGVEARVLLLARQLVAIHAVHPAEQPRKYTTMTTAETVVIPAGADAGVWSAAIDVIRTPAPSYEGRFLHRDFQPGNVLFELPSPGPAGIRVSGVVDWAGACWGPADLDVAHCSTNLALLHGPAWGVRFAQAYEEAGGVLAASASERLYWQVRDALACSEEVPSVARPWQEAGRADLTTRAVEQRLDAYLSTLMDTAA